MTVRVYFNIPLSERIVHYTYLMLGINLVIKGTPSRLPEQPHVCNHRTTLDPIIITIALGRKVWCVTYSLSTLSRFLYLIPAVALTCDREADAAMIKALLQKEDLVVCNDMPGTVPAVVQRTVRGAERPCGASGNEPEAEQVPRHVKHRSCSFRDIIKNTPILTINSTYHNLYDTTILLHLLSFLFQYSYMLQLPILFPFQLPLSGNNTYY